MLTYYRGELYPQCNQTLTDTIVDMQLLSQITTRIRLYNNDCNQTALVLEAIKQTKTNLKVFPAIEVIDKDDVGYQRQKAALQLALHTYGTDNILGVIVGNEFMFNYLVAHNLSSVDGVVDLAASTILKARIADIRQVLTSMNINLQIGTADQASYFNSDLLNAVDFGCAFISRYLGREVANVLFFIYPACPSCTHGLP
jgi:exo-beta-1,3-glucanase (GH17 family)